MKNRKQKQIGKKEKNIVNSNQIIIVEQEMTDSIVKAYQIIEDKKKQQEIELEEKEKKEWQEIIGQKEYVDNEKWCLKKIHSIRNYLVAMWTLFFFKEKNVRDLRATFALMKLAVVGMFDICKWGLYIILFAIIYSMFQTGIDYISNPITTFFVWFLARVFRLASFEVEKIKDGNVLIAVFSGCISFAAMVVAIIAIFIE